MHLPFLGIEPCDKDSVNASAARAALRRGAELASLYGAAHMIGHPSFRPPKPGREKDDIAGDWMEKSLLAWGELPRIGNAPLFLENTYETSPKAIAALVSALHRDAAEGESIGVCFDVGHWHSFAACSTEDELAVWLDAYTGFAVHLHLHDNDGTEDQHKGLGVGTVPLAVLFTCLRQKALGVTATLEPHDVRAFTESINWLNAHSDAAAYIDWMRPCLEALPLDEMEKNLAI